MNEVYLVNLMMYIVYEMMLMLCYEKKIKYASPKKRRTIWHANVNVRARGMTKSQLWRS